MSVRATGGMLALAVGTALAVRFQIGRARVEAE
jgi:hypothetical protein